MRILPYVYILGSFCKGVWDDVVKDVWLYLFFDKYKHNIV